MTKCYVKIPTKVFLKKVKFFGKTKMNEYGKAQNLRIDGCFYLFCPFKMLITH